MNPESLGRISLANCSTEKGKVKWINLLNCISVSARGGLGEEEINRVWEQGQRTQMMIK